MEQLDKLKNTKLNQMNLDEAEEQQEDEIMGVSTPQSILSMNRQRPLSSGRSSRS